MQNPGVRRKAAERNAVEFKGKTLEPFQEEAVKAVDGHNDVIVATHTGNGKTLVADYVMDKCLAEGKTVIYTAPIKALSNQKYREFTALYGEDRVGLVTGDTVINQTAPVLMVTTEILRNIIHDDPERIKNLAYIILDEIHYIGDRDRGTVWEEIIMFRDPQTKILGLSATVPNAADLAAWMQEVSGQPCILVSWQDRIVKQTHAYYDRKKGTTDWKTYQKTALTCEREYRTSHLDFIKFAEKQKLFPVLFFVFSRRGCEEDAEEASSVYSLLSPEEMKQVNDIAADFEYQYPELTDSYSWHEVVTFAQSGICCHHAGLLPPAKRFAETLFEKRLIRVLYATETFAVGINFPVRTVCFPSLRKFDGEGFRNLTGSEYLQMSGRAGRRGFDTVGFVYTLTDMRDYRLGRACDISAMKPEAVRSSFCLSYNTVLTLASGFGEKRAGEMFGHGLGAWQYRKDAAGTEPKCPAFRTPFCPLYGTAGLGGAKGKKNRADRRKCREEEEAVRNPEVCAAAEKAAKECTKKEKRACREWGSTYGIRPDPAYVQLKDYRQKLKFLSELGYIDGSGELSPRGKLCASFHIQEAVLTELITAEGMMMFPPERIAGIAGGLCTDARDGFRQPDEPEVYSVIGRLSAAERKCGITPQESFNAKGYGMLYDWASGKTWQEITSKYECEEGDFVACVRRAVDFLRQIKQTCAPEEGGKAAACTIKILDRGIVRFFM